jgi:hypothetical protein
MASLTYEDVVRITAWKLRKMGLPAGLARQLAEEGTQAALFERCPPDLLVRRAVSRAIDQLRRMERNRVCRLEGAGVEDHRNDRELIEQVEEFSYIYGRLPPHLQEIVSGLLHGDSQKVIAKHLRVSAATVCRRISELGGRLCPLLPKDPSPLALLSAVDSGVVRPQTWLQDGLEIAQHLIQPVSQTADSRESMPPWDPGEFNFVRESKIWSTEVGPLTMLRQIHVRRRVGTEQNGILHLTSMTEGRIGIRATSEDGSKLLSWLCPSSRSVCLKGKLCTLYEIAIDLTRYPEGETRLVNVLISYYGKKPGQFGWVGAIMLDLIPERGLDLIVAGKVDNSSTTPYSQEGDDYCTQAGNLTGCWSTIGNSAVGWRIPHPKPNVKYVLQLT